MSTCPQAVSDIYNVAVTYSRVTRELIASDAGDFLFAAPVNRWRKIIDQRQAAPPRTTLTAAGRAVVKLASPSARKYVRRAVGNLLASVDELAAFVPEYAPLEHVVSAEESQELSLGETAMSWHTWTPTGASAARFDELRAEVRVRLVELSSLFEEYPDPLARVLSVMRRIAGCVLEPTMAAKVAAWCGNLERGN